MTRRIAAAQLSHETHAFSVVRTDLAAFQRAGLTYGNAIVARERGTNSAFGGFVAAGERHGFALLPILSVWATPSGIVTADAIETLVRDLCDGLRAAEPLDGVLLGLHGAMMTEVDRDGDGYVLDAVRRTVGDGVPVVATLDLHANISQRMVDAATALIGYDTYPHVDMAARAEEAADLLVRVIDVAARPTTVIVKPPMLPTSQNMPTDREPMRSLIALAREAERDPRVLDVTVAGGFPASDVPEAGVTVMVTTDGDAGLADEIAHRIAREAWCRRDGFLGGVTSFADAAATLLNRPEQSAKPTVVVDIGDNPWSGSPGDSAELLRFFLASRVRGAAVALIADREAVESAIRAGVGATIDVSLGGKTDRLHGDPLPIRGRVRLISDGRYVNSGPMMAGLPVDLGPTVVLDAADGDVAVLVTSRAETPIDLDVFRRHGIEPTALRVIGLKGKGHFRAAFEPIAEDIILVEGPGFSGSDLSRLPFRNVRRPIWPLDEGVRFGDDRDADPA